MFADFSRLLRGPINLNRTLVRQQASRRQRLIVEQLESRTLPSISLTTPLIGGGANTSTFLPGAAFTAQGPGWQADLRPKGDAVLSSPLAPAAESGPSGAQADSTLRLHFVGASRDILPIGRNFAGEAQSFTTTAGSADEMSFTRVKFRDVYPGIDVVYTTRQNHLQFHFLVHPGANPRKIKLAYQGADGVRLDGDGNVVVSFAGKTLVQEAPRLFEQNLHGGIREIGGHYWLDARSRVHFQVGRYNPRRALVIDPWINNPPVAVNDCYDTPHHGPLVIGAPGLLGNDHDADGDPLTPLLVDGPSHGSLTLNADGSFTYGPIGIWGSDFFTYQDFDGYYYGNTATVCIEMSNQAPVASDDSYSIIHDHTLSGNVVTNDADPDGDAITASLMNAPTHGTVTYFGENGDFIYVPHLHFVGADLFTYQVSDGAQTDSAQVNISVTNAAPAANNDTYGVHANTTINVSAQHGVLANDSDADGDVLTATLVASPAHGALSFNDNGSFSYTPDAGFSGTDSFTYTASDGIATTNTATVTLNVHGGNTAPVANGDSYVTLHDKPLNVAAPGVLSNDSDAEHDLLSASLVVGPLHAASFTFNSDGSFSYTPELHWIGVDQFSYQADDGVATDDAIVTINVENHAPTVTLTEPLACCLGDPTILNGFFTDPDDPAYDGPYTLTVTWGDGNSEAHTYAAPDSFHYEHTYETVGIYTTTVHVEDVVGAAGNAQVQARVASVQTVEWVALDSPLDANPGNGTAGTAIGLRIFPDKWSTDDPFDRRTVEIRATLFPAVAGIPVYFAVVDVDDPSANTAPVDRETDANNLLLTDNRGGYALVVTQGITDANGVALAELTVSMQPGDNYRAVASCRANDVIGLQAFQDDAPMLRIIGVPTATAKQSEVLTVWRRLHVEVDSMGLVTGNTVVGTIADVLTNPDVPNFAIVTALSGTVLDPAGDINRFKPGILTDSAGGTFDVIQNSASAADGTFTMTVRIDPEFPNALPHLGAFWLVDDDILQDGEDVPMPDTSALGPAMREAYVMVFFDVGDNNTNVPFVLNSDPAGAFPAYWDSSIWNENAFWVTYVLGAFQTDIGGDFDPDLENALGAISFTNGTGGIWICIETIADYARNWPPAILPPAPGYAEQGIVVHEVGHAVARSGEHDVTDDPQLDVGHRYAPLYLDLIRKTSRPQS